MPEQLLGEVNGADALLLEVVADRLVAFYDSVERVAGFLEEPRILAEEFPCDRLDAEGLFDLPERRRFGRVLEQR